MSLLSLVGRPIEILLVEDEPHEAELTILGLRDGRVRNRIHWVEDGEEALAFMRRQGRHAAAPRPDLILLDLNMPRMNGLEAARRLTKLFPQTPIIMFTLYGTELSSADAVEAGIRVVLPKTVGHPANLDVQGLSF